MLSEQVYKIVTKNKKRVLPKVHRVAEHSIFVIVDGTGYEFIKHIITRLI